MHAAASVMVLFSHMCGDSSVTQVQLVLEFCDLGSLRSQLDAGAFLLGPASATVDAAVAAPNYLAVLEVASDVARGMLHLHDLDIMHCDLKVRDGA